MIQIWCPSGNHNKKYHCRRRFGVKGSPLENEPMRNKKHKKSTKNDNERMSRTFRPHGFFARNLNLMLDFLFDHL